MTDLQKRKRFKFTNWVLSNYAKEDTKKCFFSDENYFNLADVYNVQSDRVWTVSREVAHKQGGIDQKIKFPRRVMVWLGVCGKGLTTPVIFEDGTMDAKKVHQRSSSSST